MFYSGCIFWILQTNDVNYNLKTYAEQHQLYFVFSAGKFAQENAKTFVIKCFL